MASEQAGEITMGSHLVQSILSIFGLDNEKKRVDSEWEAMVAKMKEDTDSIKKARECLPPRLQLAKEKLEEGRKEIRKLTYSQPEIKVD